MNTCEVFVIVNNLSEGATTGTDYIMFFKIYM